MKKKLIVIFAALVGFVSLLSAVTDDDWLSTLLAKLEKLHADYPQEKVHLHMDKPYYSIGDDIWFKAYVVNSENNELSTLSKILYVDLVDERDSIHKTVVLSLSNGLTNGEIKLTNAMVDAGNYHIKAYTRWMQNFNSDFIFDKEIVIGDARTVTNIITNAKFSFNQAGKLSAEVIYLNLADKSPLNNKAVTYSLLNQDKTIAKGKTVTDNNGKIRISLPLKEQYKPEQLYLQTVVEPVANNEIKRVFAVYDPTAKTDVQFFPEGGRLVNGLRTRVAFKAVSANGNSANVHGKVIDQANNLVTEIKSDHAGMGVFALQPVAGNTYTVVLSDDSGAESKYPLPVAGNEGYVLNINHITGNNFGISIAASKSLLGKELALIAQQNGVVRYSAKLKVDAPLINTNVAEKKFSTGIVQFTLIDAGGLPLAERLAFVNHHDQLKLDISTNKAVYGRREKVDMQFLAKDDEGSPIQSNLSVSVTDADKVKVDEDHQNSIYANLLLTSDLKGYIEDPNYYFNNENESKVRQLNNLLLTQGWRRFSWADIKNNATPVLKYQAQQTIDISGSVQTLSNKPIPNGKVSLYAYTLQGPLALDTIADVNGTFIFKDIMFNEDAKFIVKVTNAKNSEDVKIILNDRPVPQSISFPKDRGDVFSDTFVSYLQNTQKRFENIEDLGGNTIMLKEVKIKDKTKLAIDKNKIENSSKLGVGDADIVIRKEDLVRYSNLTQAFYGKAGIYLKTDKMNRQIVYRVGRRSSIMHKDGIPMMVILNGTAVEPGTLYELPASDVEAVEIIKSDYKLAIYGDAGAWGVIVVTLKNGRTAPDNTPATNIGRITVSGYGLQREFYSPIYDKPANGSKTPDLRSTIYWNPNVVTAVDGKAGVSYYTADQPGTYKVVAEGIDIDGRLARQVFTFTVK